MAAVDVGQFAFSWRIVGVLFGALMAVCLYLLARILFRRRSVGLLVALFSLVDGMLFVQSRIAMNDTYVGGFLLLAYLLFAAALAERCGRAGLAFWVGMPILGVVLGLALASKWVALYAIASIGDPDPRSGPPWAGVIVDPRAWRPARASWAGMAIAEMTTAPNTGNPAAVIAAPRVWRVAVVVGGVDLGPCGAHHARQGLRRPGHGRRRGAGCSGAALAMSPGSVQNGAPNYTFFIIMLAVTVAGRRGQRLPPDRLDARGAAGSPSGRRSSCGVCWPGSSAVVRGRQSGLLARWSAPAGVAGRGRRRRPAFWVAGRLGFGPLALRPSPRRSRVVRRAARARPHGLAAAGLGLRPAGASGWRLCVLVLPFVVYIVMYIPWAMPWQPQTDEHRPAAGADRLLAHECTDGRGALRPRLAGRAHRPDALGPDHQHVQLPQRPAGPARRVVAVVGLADGPQAGLVREHRLRQRPGLDDLRRRQPGPVVDGHLRHGLHLLAGVQAAEPRPGPDRRGLLLAMAVVVPHRPGRRSSTTSTRPCRSSC